MNEPQSFEEACYQTAKELAELIIKKQHDYGHQNILAFGELGLIVRVNDKVARLRHLYGNLGPIEGIAEPRMDAWRDLGGYSIIALMLDRGWFELELEGER